MVPALVRPFFLVVFSEAVAHRSAWHVVAALISLICIARPSGLLAVLGWVLIGLRVVGNEVIALVVVVVTEVPVIAARMPRLVRFVSAFISIRCVALMGRV